LIGALGDVATTTVAGAAAIADGLAPPTGLVTAREPLSFLELAGVDELVFGGCDVRQGDPLETARHLARGGVLPAQLVEAVASQLKAFGRRIRTGVAYGAGQVIALQQSDDAKARGAGGPAAAVAAIRADLRAFRSQEDLDRVVVVALASTEPAAELPPETSSAEGVLGLIAADDARLPASLLYAVAAIEEGCAYVNFTPSVGSSSTGVTELALERGVPHMGKDGKTGETLLRTTLAPMFRDRNFNVLSWSGFNVLGNRDGEVLDEPAANAAKTQGKDTVLGAILGEQLGTSLTRIDYVPSLADWKTAWDLVHFEGFLGTKMQLEFTWRGADSALAAPLILDLVRLIELAQRRGRRGLQTGLACFFKTPQGVTEQSFPAQMELLERLAAELRQPEHAEPRPGR
jgi:myo-inositol-1-phosphate synthase